MPARGGGGQRREGATPPPAGVPDRFKHLPARRVWPQCHPGVAARARGGAGSRPVSQRAGRAFPGARCGLRAALVEAREGPESGQNPSRLVSGGAGGGPVLKLRPGAGRAGGRICTAQGPLPSRTRRLAPRGATVAGGVTPRATDLHGWMRSLSQGTPGTIASSTPAAQGAAADVRRVDGGRVGPRTEQAVGTGGAAEPVGGWGAAGASFSFEEWLQEDTSTEYAWHGCGADGDPVDAGATFLAHKLLDDVARSVSVLDEQVVVPELAAFGPDRGASGVARGR